MTKSMLIDASHPEETRVAVVEGNRIEELDFEIAAKKQLRGNIYLAKVTRVEPSLQAAFIEYGGNRHGFLAFNEIHPDYFQIPHADREALLREAAEDQGDEPTPEGEEELETSGNDDEDDKMEAELERRRRRLMRKYKIQEVIRRRQIMLVQVVKEERGNKGAALTTYLSLAGRYCVLMPNTARGGGISRKITNASDRKRLKGATNSLDVPTGMGLIVRTAGAARTKAEIKRDYEYLLRQWENIRETTLKSIAPALINSEEDLVKRAVRDMFDKDFDTVEVEGEAGYREARDFMRMLMPSQAKKVVHYKDATPLFVRHRVEDQIAQIHSPVVPLKSGGYLVINQTEALVAIDVNSGKATRERNIETTAYKTNMEAAAEAARQLRLRDLAGLIVIDFIDMDEAKNNRAVEKELKDCLREDRARVQMGKISQFGLMEISRQRRRMGVLEGSTHVCEHCQGAGRIRSIESAALAALRAVELEAAKGGAGAAVLRLPTPVGLYVLNEKRAFLNRLEAVHGLHLVVVFDEALHPGEQEIERTEARDDLPRPALEAAPARYEPSPEDLADEAVEDDGDVELEDDATPEAAVETRAPREARLDASTDNAEAGRGRGRRRRRRGGRDGQDARGDEPASPDASADASPDALSETNEEDGEADAPPFGVGANDDTDSEGRRRRRRRGRRGGRRPREEETGDVYAWREGQAPPAEGGDAYAWRDAQGTEGPAGASATLSAGGAEAADGLNPLEETGGFPAAEDPAATPVVGAATAAEPVNDPYAWTQTGSAESLVAPPAEADAPEPTAKPRRPRRPRGARAEVATTEATTTGDVDQADAPGSGDEAEVTTAPSESAPDLAVAASGHGIEAQAAPDPVIDPQPEPVAAAPEPTPAPIFSPAAAPRAPDPSEIGAPPAQPRRGWWRRG